MNESVTIMRQNRVICNTEKKSATKETEISSQQVFMYVIQLEKKKIQIFAQTQSKRASNIISPSIFKVVFNKIFLFVPIQKYLSLCSVPPNLQQNLTPRSNASYKRYLISCKSHAFEKTINKVLNFIQMNALARQYPLKY